MTLISALTPADTVYGTDQVPVDQTASGIARTAKASLNQVLQTLPAASTSTAGLVKIDGITIISTNGVLSAVASGGSSYTGAAPIVVANGQISVAIGTASNTVAAGNHNHDIVYEKLANKNVANGYPALDATSKVPVSQLPIATNATAGAVRPDGTSITISNGIISSSGGSGGGATITGVSISTGSTYVMQTADRVVDVNKTSGGAITVTLPSAPTLWVEYTIVDGKGDASTNNISVHAPGGGTIDGSTSDLVINQDRNSFSFRAISTNAWRIT